MFHVDTDLQVPGTVLAIEQSQSAFADYVSEWIRRKQKEGRIWENLSWIWGYQPFSTSPSSFPCIVSS